MQADASIPSSSDEIRLPNSVNRAACPRKEQEKEMGLPAAATEKAAAEMEENCCSFVPSSVSYQVVS